MTGSTRRKATSPPAGELETFILQQVLEHPDDIARITAEHFGITRQAVSRHLKRLVEEGKLQASGATRSRTYDLAILSEDAFSLDVSPALDEHEVWRARVSSLLRGLPKNVEAICHYGFTEMLNNVVDHSEGRSVTIAVRRTAASVVILIRDDGVGIFRKITKALDLSDERLAVLELSKGKLTTDPRRHSGEGIFFTSRMFDTFYLASGPIRLLCRGSKSMLLDAREPWLPVQDLLALDPREGTDVLLDISTQSERTMESVFDRFSDSLEEDYGFVRTQVPVSLARFGEENLVSRSQAKRLLVRFERFKEVVLDFSGVETVGQAFADEIFRVFPLDHPGVRLSWLNATSQVEKMIRRAIAARGES
ncbi:ArsR family transcriptional regulator [Chondromyces crocatus]|uniref:ArsR family transcriptional regulator n=2 Tax=Chondromyces crocatus TaxID=52 RepID=A0A0K1EL43_CHOCO|nr:ArsR family transcriptional regulator [Chondromyces crocatus]